jgi:hypothetical protein
MNFVVALAVGAIAAQVVIDLGFGALGQTPGDRSWSYVVALIVTLGISGLTAALAVTLADRLDAATQPWNPFQNVAEQLAPSSPPPLSNSILKFSIRANLILSGIASGALAGFYYGGIWSDKDSKMAVAGAILGGVLMGILQLCFRRHSAMRVAVGSAAAVLAYGCGLFVGAWAIAALTSQHWFVGVSCSLVSLFYFWCTLRSFFGLVVRRSGRGQNPI